jgi:hypothetical protein
MSASASEIKTPMGISLEKLRDDSSWIENYMTDEFQTPYAIRKTACDDLRGLCFSLALRISELEKSKDL